MKIFINALAAIIVIAIMFYLCTTFGHSIVTSDQKYTEEGHYSYTVTHIDSTLTDAVIVTFVTSFIIMIPITIFIHRRFKNVRRKRS